MMYALGLLISVLTGYLCVRILGTRTELKRLNPAIRSMSPQFNGPLHWILGAVLGLGLNGWITFFIHLVFEWHAPWAPIIVSLAVLMILIVLTMSFPNVFIGNPGMHQKAGPPIKAFGGDNFGNYWPGIALLAFTTVFISLEANHYPLGGWDAWSCWNLKAKFIYLGQENWKVMFDPVLWRSNTQYPLLLPCINVWFWDLTGKDYAWVPMLNSIVFVLLTAGVLIFGLYNFSKQWLLPSAMTAAIFLLPFNVTLGASQYSDIVLGLYLCCALVCFMADELVLSGLFLGLLSFTKTEGMLAALILSVLMVFKHKKNLPGFLTAFVLAALPTFIFTFFMAPRNEAFINGLISSVKPSTLARLQTIAVYPFFELVSLKWNGLWLLILGGLAVCRKNALGGKLQTFALFFMLYLGVLFVYYHMNTFFEITWWLQNTLNRILFALLPSAMLWLGASLLLNRIKP